MNTTRVRLCGCVRQQAILLLAGVLILTAPKESRSQMFLYRTGQNVATVFDGFEENPDGTFNMVFGYFNRNLEQKLDIPIGPDNNVEPGGPDQGQPTHLLPRLNHYVFRVKVPKDFGTREIVWTLTAHGKTEKAYASLRPEYLLDKGIIQIDEGGGQGAQAEANQAPAVTVEGDMQRTVRAGEVLSLTAIVRDDGLPPPAKRPRRPSLLTLPPTGLRVAWFLYRGSEKDVLFEPEQLKVYPDRRPGSNSPWAPGWMPPPVPADGRYPVKLTFNTPGTFVVRVMAHDGGLINTQNVTVTVQ